MMRIKPVMIFEKLKTLNGIVLNAVLQNGKTYYGTLVEVTNDFIVLEDTRYHSHKFPITTIYEVVYDYGN